MQEEGQKAQVQVSKLASDRSNWVIYCNRLKWALWTNSFTDHSLADSPPADYLALSDIGGISPDACWAKEKTVIKQVLGSTLPNTALNRIKATTSVKGMWDILKCIYEERSKALITNIMHRF
jgi:hypothetical protein